MDLKKHQIHLSPLFKETSNVFDIYRQNRSDQSANYDHQYPTRYMEHAEHCQSIFYQIANRNYLQGPEASSFRNKRSRKFIGEDQATGNIQISVIPGEAKRRASLLQWASS